VRSPRIQDLSGRNALMESMDDTLRQIQAAKQHLHALKMKLTREHSILHGHVRKLPNEVLSLILGIHLNSTLDSVPQYNYVPGPGRLSPLEVCRKWRDVALAAPTCWTTLVIGTEWAYSKAFKINLLRQIHLSRSLPMHFIIHSNKARYVNGEIHDTLKLCLKKHLSRIRSYAETGDAFGRHSMLATFLRGGALSLTHLHLRNVQLPTVCPSTWVLPALKFLYIEDVEFGCLKMLLERCPTLEYLIYTAGSNTADKCPGALALQNLPSGLRRLSLPATDLQLADYWKWSDTILPLVKPSIYSIQTPDTSRKFAALLSKTFSSTFPIWNISS
jgi:hypothetical protein